MIGRKATVGLALLCALLFSAFAVQSASAASATNITLFTCVPGGTGFSDAHCDNSATPGTFGHTLISGVTKNVEIDNKLTGAETSPQKLEGKPFGVTTNISCTTLAGTGSIENIEPKATVHQINGAGTFNYTGCTASAPAKCTVKNPIVAKIGSAEALEGLTGPKAEANAMGIELKAEAGKPFAEVTLEGAECALKGKPFPVEGSVIVTNGPVSGSAQNKKFSGATAVAEATESMSKLVAGGKPALYSGIATFKMEGGNPISTTTVT